MRVLTGAVLLVAVALFAVARPPTAHRGSAVSPRPARYAYCETALRAHGIDLVRENAEALETARVASSAPAGRWRYDAIVVPGYTPLDLTDAVAGVHPVARERLDRALEDLRAGLAPLVIVSGGNVHPANTPYTEALEMKRYLIARGAPAAQIVVEPCARHSHTNLRDAGRFLLYAGLRNAVVVSTLGQSVYFAERGSTFEERSLFDLGYRLGALRRVDAHRTEFVPSERVLRAGRDPLDP